MPVKILRFSPAVFLAAALPPTGAVAAMAYSLYLTHKQIYHMVHTTVGSGPDDRPILAFGVYSLAALAGGALLYWTVERPFLRLREKLPRTSLRTSVLAEA